MYGDSHYSLEENESIYTNSLLLNITPPDIPVEVLEPLPEEPVEPEETKEDKKKSSIIKYINRK